MPRPVVSRQFQPRKTVSALPRPCRNERWPLLLDGFLSAHLDASFVWGKCDCVLFACDAIMSFTGIDLATRFRGRYSTELGAARLMKRFAGGGLREAAEKIALEHGLTKLATPALAQRGDAVLLPSPFGEALGIVSLDARRCIAISVQGLIAVPTGHALRAWRV